MTWYTNLVPPSPLVLSSTKRPESQSKESENGGNNVRELRSKKKRPRTEERFGVLPVSPVKRGER